MNYQFSHREASPLQTEQELSPLQVVLSSLPPSSVPIPKMKMTTKIAIIPTNIFMYNITKNSSQCSTTIRMIFI